MKKILILLFILTKTYSQEVELSGNVTDTGEEPISYVNIGVLNKELGTVTDSLGRFSLLINKDIITSQDTIKISCIGFDSKLILIKDISLDNNLIITLDEKIVQLDEVIVLSRKLQEKEIGVDKTETSRKVNFSIVNREKQNLGAEIGKKFNLKKHKENALTSFSFFLKQNEFDKVKFRVNIYSIQKNTPKELINKKNIFVEIVNSKKGWISVDLADFNIVVSEDVIISIEWVEHSKNNGAKLSLPIIIPSLFSTHYYKFGSQAKWTKYKGISSAMKLVVSN